VNLNAVLERYAGLEKRGVLFYRGLAERWHDHHEAARLWRELSNTEASHFALLELAQDWVAMAGGGQSAPALDEAAFEALSARMAELEAAAGRSDCAREEAVELSIRWEELELPRILELVAHLPARARGQVMAGMVAEGVEHYRMLQELVRVAGAASQAERVNTLAERCRSALG
jgi:rubrerythrin